MHVRLRTGLVVVAGLLMTAATVVGVRGRVAADSRPLDAVLRTAIERGDAPGLVAVAADRGGVLYSGSFGVAESAPRRPMASDAIFRIASMTKPITSVAAMQLVEAGRISLDDPADRYLPALARLQVITDFDPRSGAYRLKPAAVRPTIRHLMTHTSGLGYPFTSAILRDLKPREGEPAAAGPLLFEPGTRWHYGTSTDWLGRLIETVSGEDLDAYFRNHIFGPLGMAETYFNVPEPLEHRMVDVYRRDAGGGFARQPRQPARGSAAFNGGGGLSSTAADYIRFVQMLLNHGTGNGARILTAASVAAMAQNQIGSLGVPALKTAIPAMSADFTFIDDGRDKWGLGFLISSEPGPGLRSAGSLSWGGIDNTFFWIDDTRGVGGVILMQFLPFADARALAVYQAFERGVYQHLLQ